MKATRSRSEPHGFERVAAQIAKREGISRERARIILRSRARAIAARSQEEAPTSQESESD